MSDNITADSLAGGQDVSPTVGAAAVSEDVVGFKDLLNKELGKDFKDDQTALKAVKDTFSYIGDFGRVRPVLKELQDKFGADFISKMEQLNQPPQQAQSQPVDTSNFVTRAELEQSRFYAERQDLKPFETLIEALVAQGKPRAEVLELPALKKTIENAKAYEEVEKSKSVLQTNPRLGVAADNVTRSREALEKGDFLAANKAAIDAVAEAYNLK